jgi:hypothetical protein
MYLPLFLVCLVCVCVWHGVHRQTNRQNRDIDEIVPAHTRVHFLFLFDFLSIPYSCWLTLCFSSIQGSFFEQKPVVSPASRRFCRAFIAWVSVLVSRGWVLRYCGWVKVLIFFHYLTCIRTCILVCLCTYTFLTLCFSSVQGSWFRVQQQHVGTGTRHFCRAFIASVSVRVSRGWVLRYCGWVKVLIFFHYLTCIRTCILVCLCTVYILFFSFFVFLSTVCCLTNCTQQTVLRKMLALSTLKVL